MSSEDLARRLVDRINAHDLAGLSALLSPDHRFIDSLGAELRGRDTMQEGWRQYLQMVPDYRIELDRGFGNGAELVLIGRAGGTYTADGRLEPRNAWSTPAAWRVLTRDGLVAEWQVYADNEPIRRCMARMSA